MEHRRLAFLWIRACGVKQHQPMACKSSMHTACAGGHVHEYVNATSQPFHAHPSAVNFYHRMSFSLESVSKFLLDCQLPLIDPRHHRKKLIVI